ncbi:MAG: GntR family transcriptional regulator [Dehalobacterium sp.]
MQNTDVFSTKSDYVYSQIKNKILKGELKQGENITISKMAEEYNISAIPVREALKRLETEGLVEIIPHKGAQVITLNANKIKEVISIRAVLEGYAARTAIPFLTEEKLAKLNKMIEKMHDYAAEGDSENYGITNKEFHRFLYKQSPLPLLYDMIFKLWDGGNWSKAIFAFYPERMKESVNEHLEIIKAIEEKDEERVEFLVRSHKEKNGRLLEEIKKYWVE